MFILIKSTDFELRPGGTVKFEGGLFRAETSFFHVKNDPGTGSALHVHPYPETWIVRTGKVRFTVGGEQIEAQSGDIVIADPDTPHKYLNVGSELLEMFCIHPSPGIIQEMVGE